MASILSSTVRTVGRVAASIPSRAVRHVSTKDAGLSARVAGVLGAQWGDEGKGKLADVLAEKYDIVGRFNGGANAGHTVVANGKKFAFHLLPCGLIHPHTKNILGNGTVIHTPSLFNELAPLDAAGIEWRGRLLVSDRAHLLFDFHKTVDGLNEKQRVTASGQSIGTTKQGIGPAYSAKAQRNAVRVGHLKHRAEFRARLRRSIEEHQAMFNFEFDTTAELDKYDEWATKLAPMVVDGVKYIHDALAAGKRILAEGANAAMLDIDFGTYPFVTSSSTTAGGICTGLGIPPRHIESLVGVVKAYTTRVGGGPFPTELTDERGGGDLPLNAPGTEIGLHLQQVGREVGVTTGRKRRCGWFDAVVVRYAHAVNGFTALNLTKLDVLDELSEVKIAVAYKLDGRTLTPGEFPSTLEDLKRVEVVYDSMPGWGKSIASARRFSDLPPAAQAYVRRIEEVTGLPVAFIGTGPARDDMIMNGIDA